MQKAEVTAFLSIVFVLLVSFTGGILESASIQVAKNYRRGDMNRAIECVFAEYQKELLETYDVFALDAGYGEGEFSEEQIYDRLQFYGAENFEGSIERIMFLSDAGAFSEQACKYMEHKYGLNYLKDMTGLTAIWIQQGKDAERLQKEEINNQTLIEDLSMENKVELPKENNPMDYVKELKESSLLELVMPEEKTVSERMLPLNEVLSNRISRKGFGSFEGTSSPLLFGEYLLEHFTTAADDGGNVLDYEVEYLLAGKESDRENLDIVVKKLMGIRFVANYAFLQSSTEKRAEAEALSLTLCALFTVPAISTAVTQGIMLAWAYGESMMDVRSLIGGQKVPLVKDSGSWQLSLAGLMKLKETKEMGAGANYQNGLSYQDYLRILLYLEKQETLEKRALDLIEQNLRKIKGIHQFQADSCVTKLEFRSSCRFRRDITYQFSTYYEYQ